MRLTSCETRVLGWARSYRFDPEDPTPMCAGAVFNGTSPPRPCATHPNLTTPPLLVLLLQATTNRRAQWTTLTLRSATMC